MTLHVVRCDDVPPQPWRNGGGLARDLLAWPQAQGWCLRISVADIGRDGPFSHYPGVERWFAVVEGAGVRLKFAERTHMLDTLSAALHFRGEDAPGCELLDGPTRDLNLMCRRGSGVASMQRAEPGVPCRPHPGLRALFSADPVTLRIEGGDIRNLEPFTLVWTDDGAQQPWCLQSSSPSLRAWWMSHEPGVGG